MKNFRTFDLAVEFYKFAKTLPLKGPVKNQFARASLSISLNLAEGRGRKTLRDQRRFFDIALGSLRECQAIMKIEGLNKTDEFKLLDRLGASVYLLIKNAR